ncbi:MAG TPA: hypothetical protein VI564_06815 [Candidatus Nanoarchaeia archaeon]|nr:hypothetical protein [Candidatus Nanoarchaeia archaeon]
MAKKTIKRVTKKIVTRKTKILKKSRQNIAKIVNRGKKLAKAALRDPITKEYIRQQKKLAGETLKKVIRRMEKKAGI